MDKLAATGIIYRIFSSKLFISVSICLKCHEVVATKSFHLVNLLTGQLDSQRIFVPCEARILWYSADRTSSRALRDTTNYSASHSEGSAHTLARAGSITWQRASRGTILWQA